MALFLRSKDGNYPQRLVGGAAFGQLTLYFGFTQIHDVTGDGCLDFRPRKLPRLKSAFEVFFGNTASHQTTVNYRSSNPNSRTLMAQTLWRI